MRFRPSATRLYWLGLACLSLGVVSCARDDHHDERSSSKVRTEQYKIALNSDDAATKERFQKVIDQLNKETGMEAFRFVEDRQTADTVVNVTDFSHPTTAQADATDGHDIIANGAGGRALGFVGMVLDSIFFRPVANGARENYYYYPTGYTNNGQFIDPSMAQYQTGVQQYPYNTQYMNNANQYYPQSALYSMLYPLANQLGYYPSGMNQNDPSYNGQYYYNAQNRWPLLDWIRRSFQGVFNPYYSNGQYNYPYNYDQYAANYGQQIPSPYQQGAYPQTNYPSTGVYPSTGYPTTGYPSTGYPTTGYPTTGYPSTGDYGANYGQQTPYWGPSGNL